MSLYVGEENIITVVRARQLDDWTNEFIVNHENPVVIYLGCGLDTRINRIEPGRSTMWFDINYPEVIELRKKFFAEKENYQMIGSSITDPGWLQEIPTNRPTLVVAERVLEYLSEQDVRRLFDRLISDLSHGQIIFDIMNALAIKSGNRKIQKTIGAVLKWSVDKANEIDEIDSRLETSRHYSGFQKQVHEACGPEVSCNFWNSCFPSAVQEDDATRKM